MTIKRIVLEQFTAFESFDIKPSRGVNVLIGGNGTGKTHLMLVAYAACDISTTKDSFEEKLVRLFLPAGRQLGRLVKRSGSQRNCRIQIQLGQHSIESSFSSKGRLAKPSRATIRKMSPVSSVYVPVKEMLVHAPGFRSLYNKREIHFDEACLDILNRASIPNPRQPIPRKLDNLRSALQKEMNNGTVVEKGEEFYLASKDGHLEFTLLAEGMRKLGLLWLLIGKDIFVDGSVLFWDEPEANLNPKFFPIVVDIVLELQRMGVQVFIATHDYGILRELDLQKEETDKIAFHGLYSEGNGISYESSDSYLDIRPNWIVDAYNGQYDRHIKRSLA